MTDNPTRFIHGTRSFVTYRLARVQNRLNAQAASLLKAHCHLSLTEWRVISLINMVHTATATQMAREVQMDKGQISRALKGLIDKGYVASQNNDRDARQSLLSLTEKGKETYDRLISVMQARQERLTENISDADLETFFAVLDMLEERASSSESDQT